MYKLGIDVSDNFFLLPSNNMRTILILSGLIFLNSCAAFMHGYTDDKALNRYLLVNGNKANFGDKRLNYSQRFHKNTDLDIYLKRYGRPDMTYEYNAKSKHLGIQLFYTKMDSVFVFDVRSKHCLCAGFIESRTISDYEKSTYDRLSQNNDNN